MSHGAYTSEREIPHERPTSLPSEGYAWLYTGDKPWLRAIYRICGTEGGRQADVFLGAADGATQPH